MIKGFRPLAGINCNALSRAISLSFACFRPLAGINCNVLFGVEVPESAVSVPSRG